MASKPRQVRFCMVLLIFSVTRDLAVTRLAGLLIDGCRVRNIDLLLIADGNFPSSEEQNQQVNFFIRVLGLFLSPDESELTRLKVALTSMTSFGPVEHFSFLDYNKTEELKQAILNTSMVNFTSQTSPSYSTARPTENSPFHAFLESEGGRNDVDRVVVMMISKYSLAAEKERLTRNDTDSPTNEYDYSAFISKACENVYNAKIFHVNIETWKSNFNGLLSCLPLYNPFNPGFTFDTLDFTVPVDLCGEIVWFYDESLTVTSWYYVLSVEHNVQYPSRITWYEAEDWCVATGGELASIETSEEFDFLQSRLKNLLGPPQSIRWANNPTMIIGLRRNTETVAARFQWRNGKPLLLSHWLPDYPRREVGQNCGLWEFRWRPYEAGSPFVGGFSDIGCRSFLYNTKLPLCEVPLKHMENRQPDLISMPSASRVDFTDALDSGEFITFDNALVSVAANVQNLQFLRSLINSDAGFPVFNCEPGSEPGSFIPYSYVCDHKPDCKNVRDETICLYRECGLEEFTCDSGQCVPAPSRCDLFKDCYDGSDEQGCRKCTGMDCPDGTCLPKHYLFDGERDCTGCKIDEDGCDEEDEDFLLGTVGILEFRCVMTCNRGTTCVYQDRLGDGIIDCTGPEGPLDETVGMLNKSQSCQSTKLPIWSPVCVYVKDLFGGTLGCRDMSHLSNCQNFTCPEGYVKCPESYCIPLHYVLDGNMDCPLGEDEKMEPTGCKGNFACWGGRICLHPDLVCDGSPQCPSGDDELDCNVTCADGFRCIGGTVTVGQDFDQLIPLSNLSFINTFTQYLDLSGVDLSYNLPYENRGRFYNLIELRLSGCKLQDAAGEFVADHHRLKTVYSVDMSYNLIKEITEHSIFSYMSNLHHLDLSHNKLLTVLPSSGFQTFSEASNLQYLDLSDTAITHIHQTFLQGLIRLNTLNLSGSDIEQITESTFPENFVLTTLDLRKVPLLDIEPDSLKEVTIYTNLYADNYKLCCPQIRGSGIPEHTCQAPQDAVSSCFDLVRDETQQVLLWLVGMLALVGNVVVILYRVVFDINVLKKSYGLFVTNLSMADLLMGIYLIVIAWTDMQYRGNYVLHEKTWRHSVLCQVAGFLSTLASETSAFFIFLVTVDRFLVIKFPFGQHKFSKVGKVVSCAAAWCLGFVLALIPVLPAFSDWTIYSSSGMCLGLPLTTERPGGWGYSVAIFIVLNFIMFVVIACGQYLIYKAVSDNRMAGAAVAQNSARRAQDIMIAKQLSLVALSDFLCWFPIGFMGLLALSGHEISKDAYTWSAVLVLPVNSALNPVLYTVPVLLNKWEKFKTGRLTITGSNSKTSSATI